MQPGHIFPLQAHDGGVLMRAGHTEAGCDLAAMAGLAPAAVICEVMNDDGTMARLPDLVAFAEQHGLKIGTIASLIEHRSRNESLIERAGTRKMLTPQGEFDCTVYTDKTGGLHLALTRGRWTGADEVLVRVHEPLSVLDLLDAGPSDHSWPLPRALAALQKSERGAAVLLNCGEDAATLLPQLLARSRGARRAAAAARPAHLRRRRADPARPRRREDEAARQPAPDAEHGGLRPGSERLRRGRAAGRRRRRRPPTHAQR